MKNFSIFLFLIIPILLSANISKGDESNHVEDAEMHAGLFASGPILSDSLMMFSLTVQADNASLLKQLNAHSNWWKHVTVYYQTMSMSTLVEGYGPNDVRDATKRWQIRSGLTNPLKNPDDAIQKISGGHYLLSKRLLVKIPGNMKPPGTIFIVFAALDTREAAKVDNSIPSLYIPPMGVSISLIRDKSALQNSHDHQNYIADRFRIELLRGNFEKAKEWIQKYLEAEGDSVIAAEFQMKIFLYQREFQKALEQYKKMATMDAQYRKEHPDVEAYVLPQMVDEFEKKINAAIEREKAKSDTEEVQ